MARHMTELTIETYRGISNLSIKDLGDVNILVGDNNTGKTSVLEAIQILSDPSEYNIMQVARQREKYKFSLRMGLPPLDLFMYMFNVPSNGKDTSQYKIALSSVLNQAELGVSLHGEMTDQLIDLKEIAADNPNVRNQIADDIVEEQEEVKTFVGKILYSTAQTGQLSLLPFNEYDLEINKYTKISRYNREKSLIGVRIIQTVDHVIKNAFSNIIKNKEIKEKAIVLLKNFDPSISDLRYINDNDRFFPVVENDHHSEYLPLSMYGDGMKKVLTILNALVSAENGIVLIDEFETALHTSVMGKVFEFVYSACKQLNVQLFLTTHSIEAVDKLLECAGEEIDNVRIITLKKDSASKQTLTRNLKGSEVLEDRMNFDFEVRQ